MRRGTHCLVTGGAGFLGGHLVRALLERGCRVRVLDDFSGGSKARLEGLDIDLVEGNAAIEVTAAKASQSMDAIFHLAALPSVERSIRYPLETYRANTLTTAVMLEEAARAGAACFVLASSCAVYGLGGAPSRESSPTQALSPYAASKLAAESFVAAAANTRGMNAMSLRFFNLYGPGQDPRGPYAAVVPRFASALEGGGQPVIYGDGLQERDFLYVGDAVNALIGAATVLSGLDAAKARGRAVNIGSGNGTSIRALLDTLAEAAGAKASAKYEAARTGEVRFSRADISLASEILGWRPATPLDEGLRRVLASSR